MKPNFILQAHDVNKTFGTGRTQVVAVNDVSLQLSPGELVLIMGPSGSGKTTLLSMLGGLLKPSSGRIYITDDEISALDEKDMPDIRANKIGFIFQAFNLMEALNVEENILLPSKLISKNTLSIFERADYLIRELGLEKRRYALPATLSGGEKQRVAIARALINKPPLILADEPTGNLDSQTGQDVMMILHDIARDEQCAVLLVTHDPRVEEIADRVLWLEDGALYTRKHETQHWSQDPVCGMRVNEWTTSAFSEFNGRHYSFCSQRCKQRFDAEPVKYI